MRSILPVVALLGFLTLGCNPFLKKTKEDSVQDTVKVKSDEELLAEEQARLDSIQQAEYLQMQQTPFGDLRFGMGNEEVAKINEKRQQLGKFNYNFAYSFTPEDQLYRVKISGDGVKALRFDADLKASYQNLLNIITTRYGEPETKREFPSIFEVQNVKKYSMNKWTQGSKSIDLSLLENNVNSYSAVCEITDTNLSEAEQARIKKEKNKDVQEASEKF